LQTLALALCTSLTDVGLAAIAGAGCAQTLTSLDLDGCCAISDTGLSWIAKGCPWIEHLNLGGRLHSNGFGANRSPDQISIVGLLCVAAGCPRLLSIDIRRRVTCQTTDEASAALIAGCPRLHPDMILTEHFRGLVPAKADRFLAAVIRSHGHELATLSLADCTAVTAVGLRALASGCTGLVSLNLSQIGWLTDDDVAVIAGLPQLQSLALGCAGSSLTDLALSHLQSSKHAEMRAPSRQLRSISIAQCVEMTDAGLVAFVGRCGPDLEAFDVAGCTRLTDDTVRALVNARHSLPNLARVNLGWCPAISNTAVAEMVAAYPCLTDLDIESGVARGGWAAGCKLKGASPRSDISDDDVLAAIAAGLPLVRSLRLSFRADLTDTGVLAVARGCLRLTSLDLHKCLRVTDSALAQLVEGCPRLLPSMVVTAAKGDLFLAAVARTHPTLRTLGGWTAFGWNVGGGNSYTTGSGDKPAARFTTAGLVAVARGCSKLPATELVMAYAAAADHRPIVERVLRAHQVLPAGVPGCRISSGGPVLFKRLATRGARRSGVGGVAAEPTKAELAEEQARFAALDAKREAALDCMVLVEFAEFCKAAGLGVPADHFGFY
jgi:hypothetical protein